MKTSLNSGFSLQPDPLSAQFSHMTLAQQQQPGGGGGASVADARHYSAVYHHHHHHASPMMLQGGPQHQQHPQQVASYMVAGPSGVHPALLQGQPVSLPTPGGPNHPYPSSTPGPAAFPGSALNQQLLQQHAYIQQPVQQVWGRSFASGRRSQTASHGPFLSLSSCVPDVGVLLLVGPPPALLRPAAALPAPRQPAALQLPSEPKPAPATRYEHSLVPREMISFCPHTRR